MSTSLRKLFCGIGVVGGLTSPLALELSAQPFFPTEVGAAVNGFQDDFSGGSLEAPWTVRGANVFSVSGGQLHISAANGDPNHLLYELPGCDTTTQEVLARIRVTSFGTGAYPRGGVAVGVSAASSQGINYTFRDATGEGQTGRHTAFLDDFLVWGAGQAFAWQTNVWYWMRLRQEPNAASQGGANDVFAKIWPADGRIAEPAQWQLAWNYTPTYGTRTGFAGLQAGSQALTQGGLSEMDVDYILIKAAGLPSIVVAPEACTLVSVAITNQPQSQTVAELSPATFTVGAGGFPLPTYQWYKDDLPVPGATNASFTIAASSLGDDGAAFQVVAANLISNITCSVTSSVAVLTVLADTNPPVLVRAVSIGLTQVRIAFSEPVSLVTATNLSFYALSGPGGSLALSNATLDPTQTNVILSVEPMTDHGVYLLTVNGLTDQSAAGNIIAPDSQTTFAAVSYLACDIGNPSLPGTITAAVNGYTVVAGGRDIGGTADQFLFAYQLRTGDFDSCARLEAVSFSDAWAKAGWMARETTNANSRFATVLATPSSVGTFFLSRATTGGGTTASGSFPVNYPCTWLRLQRAGNVFTGYAGVDGERWAQLGTVSLALPSTVYLGLAVASHVPGQATTANFRDLGPTSSVRPGPFTLPGEPLAACSRRTGLVISEIMYHPEPRADGKRLEFVELFNSTAFEEDLSGYRLSGDIDFVFPAGTLFPAGAFLVVAKSPGDLQGVYGIAGVLGPYTHDLNTTSGTVRLRNEQDSILLEVKYRSRAPWPCAADGAGHSLVLARPSYGETDPRAWAASDRIGGSPGSLESFQPSPLRSLVVNEILAYPGAGQDGFVELYNYGNETNDISGCILSDDPATDKFIVPVGTVMAPRGFQVFTAAELGFGIPAEGGTLYLKDPESTRVLDAVRYDAQGEGVSLGRWPDGAPQFYLLSAVTPGLANAGILVNDIVINELMYHPISHNDDVQYLELFNQGTNDVEVGGWRFIDGVSFTFSPGTVMAAQGYLVIARNLTNLLARYPNLNPGNTVGNFTGALAHGGERVALARPQAYVTYPGGTPVTNTSYVVVDEVSYLDGGRWSQWADGGGSSLELVDPRANHQLPSNWADSDETAKAPWTTVEQTGLLDWGMSGWSASALHVLGLGQGEYLLDAVEVISGSNNLVANGTFESGTNGWLFEGNHERTTLETNGFNSSRSLHVRADGHGDSYANRVRVPLNTTLAPGATATLRAQVRWLRGDPEILLRLRGNWLEAAGSLLVPMNLGTPGARNSRALSNAPPAIFEVTHRPVLPASSQAVVVTARLQDPDGLRSVRLKYRIDPATNYSTLAMTDDGSGGDAVAGDGLYGATLPGQPAGTLVAFYVEAEDQGSPAATSRFPAEAPAHECLVRFGEPQPFGSFGTYRIWVTQATFNRWVNRRRTSNEPLDCTFVSGTDRVIYSAGVEYGGSVWKAAMNIIDTPTGNMCDYNVRLPADDQLLNSTALRLNFPGNVDANNRGLDATAQVEPASFWIARQLGVTPVSFRHVNLFLNGVRRGSIIYDAQAPGTDLVDEVFPDDSNGDLFEGSFWFEADSSDTSGSSYQNSFATMAEFTTVGGAKKTARYRWNWPRHGVGGSPNDYARWFELVDALNTPTNYTDAVEALVDVDNWMRTLAYEHLVNNWECFGYSHGVNMFPYKGRHGRWRLLPNDVDISFQGSPDLFTTDDPVLQRMIDHPPFRRAFWRALQDAANGPLQSAPVNGWLDSRYAALLANGISADAPTAIKSYIASVRSQILAQLATVAAPFAVSGPAFFTTSNNPVLLSGTAPVEVALLTVNGSPVAATWTAVTNWSLSLGLVPGVNTFALAGLDQRGQTVSGAEATVVIEYAVTNVFVPPAPRLGLVAALDGNLVLRFSATPGFNYQLEVTDNLSTPRWTPLAPPEPVTSAEITVTTPLTTNSPCFLRVVLQP